MDIDLGAGLRELSEAPRLPADPLPAAAVMARVRRARLVRRSLSAGLAAAVVAGTAVTVQAAPWSVEPLPPVASVTGTVPTAQPTADPSSIPAAPTPTPTTGAAPEPPEAASWAVGLVAGELVRADLSTGRTTTITSGLGAVELDLAVDASQTYAYVTRSATTGPPLEVVQVRLSDGAIEPVGAGSRPSVSPDGSTLAYLALLDHPDESGNSAQLALVDLETRTASMVPFEACGGVCSWRPHHQGWTIDGRLLLSGAVPGTLGDLQVGYAAFALVDPARPAPPIRAVPSPVGPADRVQDGVLVHPELRALTVARDGRLVVVVEERRFSADGGVPSAPVPGRIILGVLEDGLVTDPVDLTDDVQALMAEVGEWLFDVAVDEAPDGSILVTAATGVPEGGGGTGVWRVTGQAVERLALPLGPAVM